MNVFDRQVVILGAGGHFKVVADVLRAGGWQLAGLLDPNASSSSVDGIPVLGGDDMAQPLFEAGHRNVFVAIGRNDLRRELGTRLRKIGFNIVTVIHPSAVVSKS